MSMRSALLMTLVAVMLNTAESFNIFDNNIDFSRFKCMASVEFYGLQAGETPGSIKNYAPERKMAFVKKATRNRNTITAKQQRALKLTSWKNAFEVVGAVVLVVGICVGTLGAGCAEGAAVVAQGAMTLASGSVEGIGLVSLEQGTALVGVGEESSGVAYYGSVGYNLEEAEAGEFLALREDELMGEGSEFYFGAEAEEEDELFGLKYSEVRDSLFDKLDFVRDSASSAFDFAKTNAVPRKLVSFDGDPGACNLVDKSFRNDFAQTKVTITYLTRAIRDLPSRRLERRVKNTPSPPNNKRPCPWKSCQTRLKSENGQESSDDDPDSAVASAASGLVGISSGLVGHVLLALVLLCIAL